MTNEEAEKLTDRVLELSRDEALETAARIFAGALGSGITDPRVISMISGAVAARVLGAALYGLLGDEAAPLPARLAGASGVLSTALELLSDALRGRGWRVDVTATVAPLAGSAP